MLLAVPLEIEFTYNSQSRRKSTTSIVWLFGLVRFQLARKREADFWDQVQYEVTPIKRNSRKPAGADNRGVRVFFAVLRSEGFIRRLFRLIYEILTVARINRLRVRLLFGLDDPADTGFIYGLLSPGFSSLYALPQVDFDVTPVFDRSVVETNMEMKIRVVPVNYLKAVVLFVFSRESFRATKAAFRVRRQ